MSTTPMGTGYAGPGLAYSPAPSGSGYQSALGMYSGMAAPQQNYLDQQRAQLLLQQSAAQGAYGQSQAGLQSSYDIGMGRVGLNQQENNVAMQVPQADVTYWQGLADVAKRAYGEDSQYYKDIQNLAQQWYGTQSGLIGQARGLRGQETNIGLAEALRAYTHNRWGFASDQTAKGAWNTEATTEGFSNLSQVRDLQDQALRNQLAQANVGFDTQQASAYHQLQGDLLSGQRGENQAFNDFQKELLRSGRGTAEAQSSLEQLRLKGQEYGLDERELANKLQQGLSSLNLDQTLKISDLMGALSSNDYQRQQVASQVIQQAIQASGYMPGGGYSTTGTLAGGGNTGSDYTYGQGAHFK